MPAASARIDPSRPRTSLEKRTATLRVWAAAVRDRRGEHRQASGECVSLARSLCLVLDLIDRRERSGKELLGLDKTAEQIVAALRARNVYLQD